MKMCFQALVASLVLGTSAYAANTYKNPILPGDFPDPSIIRVGEDYWATATSSEWAPLYPILHSKDLVNWEMVGTIFDKKPAWSEENYWAPELSFYKGKYYVYYVARNKEKEGRGRLHIAVATADNPRGPWTDHGPLIGQDVGSIDAVTATDEHGDHYMIWKGDGNSRKQPTLIYAQKLNEDGTKLVGEMKELFRNDAPWGGNLVEGPFVMKRGEWYYIFYAGAGCCGKGCSYGTGVARSKSLLGPYEKCPQNPILTHNEKWRCPGHGSVVSTADNRDFFVYHAYDTSVMNHVGRQGVMDEVKWDKEGWPSINSGKGVSTEAPSPLGKAQHVDLEFSDDFTTTNLNLHWQWPHTPDPVYSLEKGDLVLRSAPVHGTNLLGTVMAVQATTGDYAATAFVHGKDISPGTKVGLFAFGDRANAIGITFGDGKAQLVRREKGKSEILGEIDFQPIDTTYLRVEAKNGHLFNFSIWNGQTWLTVGDKKDLDGAYLPPWDRGIRVAITVGGNENAQAKFEWFRFVPTLPTARAD